MKKFIHVINTPYWVVELVYYQATMQETLDFFSRYYTKQKETFLGEINKISFTYKTYNPYKRRKIKKFLFKNVNKLADKIINTRHRQHKSCFQWYDKKTDDKNKHKRDECYPEYIMDVFVAKETNIPLDELRNRITMQQYGEIVDSILWNMNNETEKWQQKNSVAKQNIYKEKHKDDYEREVKLKEQARETMRKYKNNELTIKSLQYM